MKSICQLRCCNRTNPRMKVICFLVILICLYGLVPIIINCINKFSGNYQTWINFSSAVQHAPQSIIKESREPSVYSAREQPQSMNKPYPDRSENFQTVIKGNVWVLSAYYDAHLPQHLVRIMGIVHVHYIKKLLYCQKWYNHTTEPEIGSVTAVVLRHFHEDRFNI